MESLGLVPVAIIVIFFSLATGFTAFITISWLINAFEREPHHTVFDALKLVFARPKFEKVSLAEEGVNLPVPDLTAEEEVPLPVPDLAAETAPDLAVEAAPDLAAETAPDLAAETAPDLAVEAAPDLAAEAAPDLAAEVENNLRISSTPWTGDLVPFDTHIWDAEQYEVYQLPAELKNELIQVYEYIRIANQVVWFSTEFGCRNEDSDEVYRKMRTSIAEKLHRIQQTANMCGA